jgi:hypothetical protein
MEMPSRKLTILYRIPSQHNKLHTSHFAYITDTTLLAYFPYFEKKIM